VSEKNLGSSIDDFLKSEDIFEEAQAQAIKDVTAWQSTVECEEEDF
jgi:antitoxin HicB